MDDIDGEYYFLRETIKYLDANYNIKIIDGELRDIAHNNKFRSIDYNGRPKFLKSDIDKYARSNMYAGRYSGAVILTFANHKGGVGKTATVFNLAMAFALQKLKILVVDFDPQANLTASYPLPALKSTVADVMMGIANINDVILPYNDYVDVLPTNSTLSRYELEPFDYQLDTHILRKVLSPIRNQYDLILIDTPPQLSLLNTTGIRACDIIFIPIMPDYYAIMGMYEFIEYAQKVNHNIQIGGIFLTRYTKKKTLDKNITLLLNEDYSKILLKTKIRDVTAIAQAIISQQSIFEYNSQSHGATDYKKLSNEILKITDRYKNV